MIQDVFLPEKIGSYYIFRQRIVGIDITKTHINASLVIARGSTLTIEKQLSAPLNSESQNHAERVIATLPSVCEQMGKITQLRTALPSSLVVFKELRLPFTSRDKIAMVIRFEVEPLLPFPPHEAEIDFIITSVNEEEKSAQVLAVAAQKKHILEHLSLFEQAGYKPEILTVDMFALYGVYKQIPLYQSLSGSVALLEITMHTTNIIALLDGALRIIRTLPYGLTTVVKDVGSATDLKPQKVMDHLLRFGIEQESSETDKQAIQNSITGFFNKLQFALTSTFNQLQTNSVEKIILCGPGAEVKDIAPFAQNHLNAPCELFDMQKLTENKHYRINPQVTLSQSLILGSAIALPTPIVEGFNLLKGEFAAPKQRLFLKQLIISGILLIILFATLVAHSIIQSKRLRSTITARQEEAIDTLRDRFPEIPEDEEDLEEVVTAAQAELNKEEIVWRAFSSQSRTSFLEYLLELTSRINKQELGFNIDQLSIVDGPQVEITLKAQVKDYPALKKLESALQESKLFSYVEGQSDTSFEMKIIASRKI